MNPPWNSTCLTYHAHTYTQNTKSAVEALLSSYTLAHTHSSDVEVVVAQTYNSYLLSPSIFFL